MRVASTRAGYRALLQWARRWPERRWAVENASVPGRSLAQWLLGDGERVIDVPPKLSTRIRVLSTGHGHKSDQAGAASTALATRGTGEPRDAVLEGHAATLRLLSDRCEDVVARRTELINRLHALLSELLPGTVPAHLLADHTAALLRRGRPSAGPQRTRRLLAGDLVREARRLDAEVATLDT